MWIGTYTSTKKQIISNRNEQTTLPLLPPTAKENTVETQNINVSTNAQIVQTSNVCTPTKCHRTPDDANSRNCPPDY